MLSKRSSLKDEGVFRGPVRKKRILIGAPNNIPVPIARFAPRIQPAVGIVAKYAPDTTKAMKKFDVKSAGAI